MPRATRAAQPQPQTMQLTPLQLHKKPDSLNHDQAPLPSTYIAPAWAERLVKEWGLREELTVVGTHPTASLLIHGRSGVGKTTSARWIAAQLNLPVFSLSLAGTVESYMGSTGRNIDAAITYGIETPCVLVIDEVDTLGLKRGGDKDVGEMWRVINTFLQSVDRWHMQPRASLLMATTNRPDVLDKALRRRFEEEVQVYLPSLKELEAIAGLKLDDRSSYMTHAAMVGIVLRAKRQMVLDGVSYEQALSQQIDRYDYQAWQDE